MILDHARPSFSLFSMHFVPWEMAEIRLNCISKSIRRTGKAGKWSNFPKTQGILFAQVVTMIQKIQDSVISATGFLNVSRSVLHLKS